MQVDASLLLLSNITSNVSYLFYILRLVLINLTTLGSIQDFVNTSVIPQDVWDLQIFKRPNSM